MKRRILYFTAPRQVEIREETLPALGPEEVLVEASCSAISAGTEMLIYQGRFPHDLETDSIISSLRGSFRYPLAYGYACVGVVRETGRQVNSSWRDRLVFAFQPHCSHFISKPEALLPVLPTLSPETACFLPKMETAVNLVQDGAPILGERVFVFGQGVIGLLTASLLKEFPLDLLVTGDCHELRRQASLEVGVSRCLDPNAEGFESELKDIFKNRAKHNMTNQFAYTQDKFDLTFELSGNPAALNQALAITSFSGRIVIGSWYGDKNAGINLGGAFHRSRIKLISSQVSTIAPELSGRWDKSRRFEVTWKALEKIGPEKWITHRFPITEAEKAFHLLDEDPRKTIQILITYS